MKLRETLTAAVFAAIIFLFAIAHVILPDQDVSVTERRPLQQLPELTVKTVMNGKYGQKLESYLLDQFPLRDELRSLKAHWHFDVYGQADNNGIYLVGDQILKLDKVVKPDEVKAMSASVNKVLEKYLTDNSVYFALIPDKNYFVAAANGYPAMDYGHMEQLLRENLDPKVNYLGMAPFSGLTIDSYYNTDLHWRQDQLQSAVDGLAQAMDFTAPDLSTYTPSQYSPFYGSYYGQAALGGKADTITALSSPATEATVVTGLEFTGEKPVYDPKDFHEMDGYDIFLGGPQGIVYLENKSGTTGRELVVFRDSFGSSIAPLFMEGYDKVTLVDLRYMASFNLGQFVDFEDADVLFLYSTGIVNSGKLLK